MTAPARPEADIFFEKLGKTTHPRARGFFHKLDPRKRGDRGRMEAWNLAVVAQWEAEGRGTYAVVNDGGDTDESIIHCNATFGEWDNKERVVQAAFDWTAAGLPKPTMAIWTSQAVDASLHFYWCYTKPQADVMRWRLLQWRIIQLLDSDPSIENPSRIMRVPGCAYPGKGVTQIDYDISTGVKIDFFELESKVWLAEQQRGLTVAGAVPEAAWKRFGEELEGRLGLVRPVTQQAEPRPDRGESTTGSRGAEGRTEGRPAIAYSENTIDDIREALGRITPRGMVPGTYQRDRNIVWGLAAALEAIGRPREEAAGLVKAAGWKDWDVEQVVGSGGELVKQSTFWYHAKQAGYKSRKRRLPQVAAAEEAAEAEVKASELALAEQQLRDAIDLPVLERKALVKRISLETGLHTIELEKALEQFVQEEQDCDQIEGEIEVLKKRREQEKTSELLTLHYIFHEKIADALTARTRYLEHDTASVAIPYLCGQSGLLPLGSEIMAMADTNFHAPLNLFTVLVGKSGSGKTPLRIACIDEPLALLKEECRLDNKRKKKNWEDANEGVSPKEQSPMEAPLKVVVTDATPEALVQQIMWQGERKKGMLLVRDEFAGFVGSIDQYKSGGKGDGSQQFLELFDGGGMDKLLKTTDSIEFHKSHLSLHCGGQVRLIEDYMKSKDPQGFFSRFMMVPMPTDVVIESSLEDDPQREKEVQDAIVVLQGIARQMYSSPIRTLRFDKEARSQIGRYHTEQKRLVNKSHDAISGLHGKSVAKAIRVAGILHHLDAACDDKKQASDPVSLDVLTRAIALVEHCNQWMGSLVAGMGEDKIVDKVLTAIKKKSEKNGGQPVSYREIFLGWSTKTRNQFTREVCDRTFAALEKAGEGSIDSKGRFTIAS